MIVMTTIVLLTISNIFMTFAWYGHLKYRNSPLFKVIIISWLIAFAEYCFQVPANRIGSYQFGRATQGHPGSDHAYGVLRLFHPLPETGAALELLCGRGADRGSGVRGV